MEQDEAPASDLDFSIAQPQYRMDSMIAREDFSRAKDRTKLLIILRQLIPLSLVKSLASRSLRNEKVCYSHNSRVIPESSLSTPMISNTTWCF